MDWSQQGNEKTYSTGGSAEATTDAEVQAAIDDLSIGMGTWRKDGHYTPCPPTVYLAIRALQQCRTEPCEIGFDTIYCAHRLGDLVAIARLYEARGQSVTAIVDAIRYGYDEATSQMVKSMQSLIHQPLVEPEPPRDDLTDSESTQSGAIQQARGEPT